VIELTARLNENCPGCVNYDVIAPFLVNWIFLANGKRRYLLLIPIV
jgi:hypothetical protein